VTTSAAAQLRTTIEPNDVELVLIDINADHGKPHFVPSQPWGGL
jgi:hypothetical protein